MGKPLDTSQEDLADATHELTEKERYMLAAGAVLDGAVWPGMVATPDHAALVGTLCRLRLICVQDELALKHRISSTAESPERLLDMAMHVRPSILKDHPRLLPFLLNVVREVLVRHSPLALEGSSLSARAGLRGAELDIFLDFMGYRLGESARMKALRMLEDAGEVRSTKAFRWNALSRIWPRMDPLEARAHHRFCLLTMLDRVVAQRFVGMPNILWLMGFNETHAGRHTIGARMAEAASSWLESKSLTLTQAQRSNEAELVWVQSALMIARRPVPRMPLPEWLKRELELTVMPATLLRLGQGDEGAQLFKRALTERAARWVMLERQRRKALQRRKVPVGPFPKGLDVKWETLKRWQAYDSFESDKLRGTVGRGLVPVTMARVQRLLQEALPEPLTLRAIYEHAVEHWPVEFHSKELLGRALDLLVASFEAAETRIQGKQRSPSSPNWMKGYKATKLEFKAPDLSTEYCKSLTDFLSEMLQCLAEPDPTEPPFIETARYIIPRTELPALREHMLRVRQAEKSRIDVQDKTALAEGVPSVCAILTVLRQIPVNI